MSSGPLQDTTHLTSNLNLDSIFRRTTVWTTKSRVGHPKTLLKQTLLGTNSLLKSGGKRSSISTRFIHYPHCTISNHGFLETFDHAGWFGHSFITRLVADLSLRPCTWRPFVNPFTNRIFTLQFTLYFERAPTWMTSTQTLQRLS